MVKLGTVPAAIGALGNAPSIAQSGTGELLSSLGNIGPAMLQNQYEQSVVNDQLRKSALQQLNAMAAEGVDDPNMANNPQMMMRLRQVYHTLGIPMPTTTDGKPDFSKMGGTDFGSLNFDDLVKLAAEPPAIRKAMNIHGMPEQFGTLQASAAMTAAAQARAYTNVESAIDKFSVGQLAPQALAGVINLNRANLDPASVSMLTSPQFLSQGLSRYGDAQINLLQQHGFYFKDIGAYRQKLLDWNIKKTQEQLAEKRRMDTSTIGKNAAESQHWASMDATQSGRLALAQKALQANLPLISAKTTAAQWGMVGGRLKVAAQAYSSALANYTKMQTAIQGAINNNRPVDPTLLQSYSEMQKQLSDMYVQLQDQQVSLSNAPAALQKSLGHVLSNVVPSAIDPTEVTGGYINKVTQTIGGQQYGPGTLINYHGHMYDRNSGFLIQ